MIALVVDDKRFLVGDEYRSGALAQRSGQGRHSNPHSMSDPHHECWNEGFDHEHAMFHVIDGIDLITDEGSSSRTFSIATSSLKETPRARLKYARDLMRTSGMLEQSKHIFATRGPQSPGNLLLALRAKGHVLSRIFAETIIERLRLEREMQGAALTSKEAEVIEKLGDNTKQFLLGLSVLQDRLFDRIPSAELVGAFFCKPSRWPVQVARVMKREKQDFLVEIGHNRFKLSAKGWAAIHLLRSRESAMTRDPAWSLAA